MRPASVTHCTTCNTKHFQITSTLEDRRLCILPHWQIVTTYRGYTLLRLETDFHPTPNFSATMSGIPFQCISSVWVAHEGGWWEKMFKNQFHRKHRQIHLYTVINKICSIYVYKFKIWKGWDKGGMREVGAMNDHVCSRLITKH